MAAMAATARLGLPALVLLAAGAALPAPSARASAPPSPDPTGVEFFEKNVRPVLVEHCYKCHSAEAEQNRKLKGGLRLDTRAGALKGGDSEKPAVVPGDPQASLLIEAVRWKNEDLQMPPKQKLGDAQIADLVAWVNMGAPDPRGAAASPSAAAAPAAARERTEVLPLGTPDLGEVYASAWATVLPAVYEAFGLVLVESLACGTPVVAANHAALPELVTDGTGALAAPEDPASLADACRRALALAQEDGIAERCRAVAEPYDWDGGIAPRIEALYEGDEPA
jgi:mono/diheme cytochrome c family protein